MINFTHDKKLDQALDYVSEEMEYMKWHNEIPVIKLKDSWEIKLLPPFSGAIVRFLVLDRENNTEASIYLDCYDRLGVVGEPYWECYCFATNKIERVKMEDTDGLVKAIEDVMIDETKDKAEKEIRDILDETIKELKEAEKIEDIPNTREMINKIKKAITDNLIEMAENKQAKERIFITTPNGEMVELKPTRLEDASYIRNIKSVMMKHDSPARDLVEEALKEPDGIEIKENGTIYKLHDYSKNEIGNIYMVFKEEI